jgi:branched-chain amino acid transport system ATP-binding protein
MLELSDAVTGYGKARVVDGVSCSCERGEVLAVLGANGAGKTTLMRAICGSLPLWSGELRLDGESLTHLGPQERAARGITLCPEGRRILTTLTVEENLRIGATALQRRAGRSERRRLVAEGLAEAYGLFPLLEGRRGSLGGTLSGGQQQMLAIARALMSRPRLLLLDEPSLGLAPRVIDEVYALLTTLRLRGITLVLVEESSTRALELASRAIVLKNGRVQLQGATAEVRADPRLASAYLGDSGRGGVPGDG